MIASYCLKKETKSFGVVSFETDMKGNFNIREYLIDFLLFRIQFEITILYFNVIWV